MSTANFARLRRLEVHDPQRQPAPRAVDHRAHVRDQHRDEQGNGQHEQPRRHALPGGHGDLERQQRRDERDDQRHDVAHQEMGGRDLAEARVVRHGDGGGIHHHQPPGQQRHHDPQQGLVETQHARWRGGGLAVFGAAHAHGQHVGGLGGQAAEPAAESGGQALQQAGDAGAVLMRSPPGPGRDRSQALARLRKTRGRGARNR